MNAVQAEHRRRNRVAAFVDILSILGELPLDDAIALIEALQLALGDAEEEP